MVERSEAVEEQAVRDGSAVYAVEAEITTTEDVPPGYKRTEVGVIPEDWSVVKLGCAMANIIDFRGRTPKKLGMNWGGGDIPALSARNVKMGKIDFREETYYGSEKLYKRWMTNGHVEKGDVVVTMEAPLGNVALIPDHQRYILSQRTILLQPDSSSLLSEFLAQLLPSPWFQKVLQDNGTGSTATGIQRRRFERLDIPCPPITEQRAIATALSDADALIESLDRLIAKKRAIKQAAMQQLLTGQTRLPGFTGEWETKRLGNVASFHKGSGLSKADLLADGSKSCIHYGELFTQYGERITSVKSLTDSEAACFKSIENDVLMPTSDVTPNGLATASCIAESNVILGGDILVIRPTRAEIDGTFLAYKIRMDHRQIMQLVSGTTVFHIYGRDMAEFTYKAPTTEEQQAIVSVLSDLDTDIDALERRRNKACQIKQAMMQQLLTGRVRLVTPEVAA